MALDALIENAVAHTKFGDGIELGARREGEHIVLTVADEGSGIPPTELDRIFSRFSRIDAGRNRAAGGFGLGLAIVAAITQAHKGTVKVRSTVGEGSVFELRLPAAPVLASTPAGPDRVAMNRSRVV
jgi:two-component system sensor histidine kinase BaeS